MSLLLRFRESFSQQVVICHLLYVKIHSRMLLNGPDPVYCPQGTYSSRNADDSQARKVGNHFFPPQLLSHVISYTGLLDTLMCIWITWEFCSDETWFRRRSEVRPEVLHFWQTVIQWGCSLNHIVLSFRSQELRVIIEWNMSEKLSKGGSGCWENKWREPVAIEGKPVLDWRWPLHIGHPDLAGNSYQTPWARSKSLWIMILLRSGMNSNNTFSWYKVFKI